MEEGESIKLARLSADGRKRDGDGDRRTRAADKDDTRLCAHIK